MSGARCSRGGFCDFDPACAQGCQRTVSPAIGEFAVQENVRLREQVRELKELLMDASTYIPARIRPVLKEKIQAALAKVPA